MKNLFFCLFLIISVGCNNDVVIKNIVAIDVRYIPLGVTIIATDDKTIKSVKKYSLLDEKQLDEIEFEIRQLKEIETKFHPGTYLLANLSLEDGSVVDLEYNRLQVKIGRQVYSDNPKLIELLARK